MGTRPDTSWHGAARALVMTAALLAAPGPAVADGDGTEPAEAESAEEAPAPSPRPDLEVHRGATRGAHPPPALEAAKPVHVRVPDPEELELQRVPDPDDLEAREADDEPRPAP